MNNSAVILIMGAIIIFGIISFNTSEKLVSSSERSVNYFTETQVRNLCNSAVGMLISSIADNNDLRSEDITTMAYGDGYVSYTIKDTTLSGQDRIEIKVAGQYENSADTIIAYIEPPGSGFIPLGVKAAITTNSNIGFTGDFMGDGRDHNLNGDVIPNTGTYSIWSTGTVGTKGSADFAGTSNGFDINPIRGGSADIIKQNQVYEGGYPDSPEKFFGGEAEGFPDGTLKSIAQSGMYGSQYVTDPSNLTYPLKGITYVEVTDGKNKGNGQQGGGGTWLPATIDGEGILIVHNPSSNSIMKNIHGSFQGLIIADMLEHINGRTTAKILGAVIAIGEQDPKHFLGNGKGEVYYSSEAIKNATSSIGESAANNYGFGQYRLKVTDWYEKN